MQHCLTYGSLMCKDMMSTVSGAHCTYRMAWLEGYRRQPVIGQPYPGIVPAAGRCVQGVLYLDLPPSAWARLDRFEGDEYERTRVEVRLQHGRRDEAWTYVFRPNAKQRLVDGEWDFERFLRTGKARFLWRSTSASTR